MIAAPSLIWLLPKTGADGQIRTDNDFRRRLTRAVQYHYAMSAKLAETEGFEPSALREAERQFSKLLP